MKDKLKSVSGFCPVSVGGAGIQKLEPGFLFPTHFHQTAEFILCLSGQFLLNIQGEAVSACPGEYILCFPNFPHSTGLSAETGAEILQLHFHVNATDSLPETSGKFSPFRFAVQLGERKYLAGRCSEQLRACARGIYDEMQNPRPDSDRMLQSYGSQLDVLLSRDLESMHGEKLDFLNPYILTACSYIRQHYPEHLTAESVADACGITSRYLSKLFHDDLNLSVCAYITHVRISSGIERMRKHPDYPLADLALDLGFSSQQYFSAVFKQAMSVSPKKYITLHRSNF